MYESDEEGLKEEDQSKIKVASPIIKELDFLSREVQKLFQDMEGLEKKLFPILSPTVDNKLEEKESEPAPSKEKVSGRIKLQRLAVIELIERIKIIRERLEI